MKKRIYALLAVLCIFTLLPAFPATAGFRTVVSEKPPPDIQALAENMLVISIGQVGIINQETGNLDYGVYVYIKDGSATPEVPDTFMLVELTPVLDENGEAVPDKFISHLAGFVFVDEQIAWFRSEKDKAVFMKAFE